MASSNSRGYKPSDPERLIDRIRKSQDKTADVEFDAMVADFINSLLASYNNRDVDLARSHIDSITQALSKDVQGAVSLLYGGSVSKHTYVDGLSDVDLLVVLNDCDLVNKTPKEVLSYLYTRLRERFPRHDVQSGSIAITVKFAGIDIQLIPAVKHDNHLRIPEYNGVNWSRIDPNGFAQKLTKVNIDNAHRVVPVIKLAKAIVAKFPDQQRVTGYHMESIAIDAFKNYSGPYTTKSMLKHLFEEAARIVLQPIQDSTGQSIHVDEYLGTANSIQRRIVSDALGRISRKMRNSDAAALMDGWTQILE